jgi:hypothetical protein
LSRCWIRTAARRTTAPAARCDSAVRRRTIWREAAAVASSPAASWEIASRARGRTSCSARFSSATTTSARRDQQVGVVEVTSTARCSAVASGRRQPAWARAGTLSWRTADVERQGRLRRRPRAGGRPSRPCRPPGSPGTRWPVASETDGRADELDLHIASDPREAPLVRNIARPVGQPTRDGRPPRRRGRPIPPRRRPAWV